MTESLVAIGSALWLGILTSISPCPLASNVAAISFVGRSVATPRRAILSGIAYTLGRAATYVLVGMLVVSSLLSIPSVSLFLQKRMNQVLGPLLILIGVGMLGWIRFPGVSLGFAESLRKRLAGGGLWGAGLLGMLFALSFCPVSAGLFFGALIPMAVNAQSRVVFPAVYGLGTGLPVVLFAVLLVLGANWVGRAFSTLTTIAKAAQPITGGVFILAGAYLTLIHLFGVAVP